MNTTKFSKLLLTIFSLFFAMNMANAQQISQNLYGQNAWMPDSIGSKKFYGQLDNHWPAIGQSGAKIMRYGGIGVDQNRPTKYQYIKMVDNMRAQGMEPILQVSFHMWQYSAAQAAEIVNYVNNTMGRNVKYWIIANEPDLGYGYTTSSQIAPYIKQFATAMKAADPSIKIIGPETAWYNSGIINGLTTPGGPDDVTGKDANGRYYIDYISFHAYPMQAGSTSRSAVISNLTEAGHYQDNLTTLNARLANCNAYHGRTSTYALQSAVTEVNVNYKNPAGDNLNGTGTNSFLGGQYWAELLGISMKKNVSILTFWSVLEGNTEDLSIGYLARGTGAKKPAYYHFQMVSQNFKGLYADGTDNQPNVKSFGSKDGSQIAVMVMNQDNVANFNYTVRLDNNTVGGSNPLKINISAGVAKEYAGTIDNQSSQVLIFDLAGNIIKKIEYKLNGNASAGLPPTVTNISAPVATAITATVTPAGPTSVAAGGNVVLNANTGTGFTYQWNKNGAAITGATTASYTATQSGSYTVTIKSGTQTVTSAPVNVTVGTLTATITPAGSTAIATGGNVVLNANTGTGFTYQWNKNGAAIAGATAASYTATQAGSYTVTIKSGTLTATSAAVAVTVSTLTATITAAGSTTIATGGSVALNANTGTGYTYQWKKNGVAITGATAASYTATQAGSYTVTVKSGTISATSAAVTVTVTALTATITPTGSTTIAAGGNVVLKANTGTGYVYQWKKDGVAITGATAANYTATAAGSYQVKITLGTVSAYSAPVAVNVGALTATINAAGPTTISTGGNVVLNANTGSGYTYQWKKNGTAITGATAASYTATLAGSYSVTIKSGTLTATSAAVTVTVTALTATITAAGSTTIPTGGSVMLNANTGTGYTYQWKKNGVAITGATAASYKATTAGSYTVAIKSGTITATSAVVTVTIGSTTLTATVSVGGSTNIPVGGSVMLYGNTGAGYVYQWKKNGIAISGATASSYKVTGAGSYQLKITSGALSAWSAPVSITQGSAARVGVQSDSTAAANDQQAGNTQDHPTRGGDKPAAGRPGKDNKNNGVGATRGGNGNEAEKNKPAVGQSRGGNVSESTDTTGETAKTAVKIAGDVFDVKVGPNPSNEQFGFTVASSGEEPITVRVFDMNGRLCVEQKNVTPNETIKLGEQLAAGHYVAQVEQGQKKQVVKLVKSN